MGEIVFLGYNAGNSRVRGQNAGDLSSDPLCLIRGLRGRATIQVCEARGARPEEVMAGAPKR